MILIASETLWYYSDGKVALCKHLFWGDGYCLATPPAPYPIDEWDPSDYRAGNLQKHMLFELRISLVPTKRECIPYTGLIMGYERHTHPLSREPLWISRHSTCNTHTFYATVHSSNEEVGFFRQEWKRPCFMRSSALIHSRSVRVNGEEFSQIWD